MLYLVYTMCKIEYAKCSNFFQLAFIIIFIHLCTSAPVGVTENAYAQFVAELNRNKCSIPSQIILPFDTTEVNNFEYLSSYLEICQKTELTKRNKEAVVLCKEVFDNIRNISCPKHVVLPAISENLSENVCQDIGALKDTIPEDNKSLLQKLTDSLVCEIMCDIEFEKACQVLLWSFKVQKRIASVASVQEPEQPIVLEDNLAINADSVKQDITADENGASKNTANINNEKKNTKVAPDVNKVVSNNGPVPSNLENNPHYVAPLNPNEEKKQEMPLLRDEGGMLGNQAVSEIQNQNITDASKFTNSTTILSSSAQLVSIAQTSNSNSKVTPTEEMATGDPNDQNANKNFQGGLSEHDKVNAGVPNFKVTADEAETQDANALADKAAQNELDGNVQSQDNFKIPDNPVNADGSILGSEITNELPEKGDQPSISNGNNGLVQESGKEKEAKDPVSGLFRVHLTGTNDKKTDLTTTDSQVTKDNTQPQSDQKINQDTANIPKDEIKPDPLETNPLSKKVEAQNLTEINKIDHNLIPKEEIKVPSTDGKTSNVAQQTEEFDNTIPDATGVTIVTNEKTPAESQKSKSTVVNLDTKNVVPSSLTETSTKTTAALEKMEGGDDLHQPAGGEGDPYGDQENPEDEEYSRPNYDSDGLYDDAKTKESIPDVPSPITAAKETIPDQNEKPMEFPSRNAFGQDTSDIQMISSFPDQEDSHFFFYFLSIVLILMAGYLIFHNKQKIIALIVEGRHERNRRSHRIGYKKLETK